MTNLLCKRVKFIWTDNCQKSFENLKAILKSATVYLAHIFNKEFKLAIDVSDVSAGSVLLQEDDNGVDNPVWYYSKMFNKHQRNYSTIEKESWPLILALQHFQDYLASSVAPIVIFTDHNPLTFINKMKNKNQRLLRWSLMLQEHNLDIRHMKGKDNIIPNALSNASALAILSIVLLLFIDLIWFYLLVISWFICFRRWCIDKLGVFHANQIIMCLDPHLN